MRESWATFRFRWLLRLWPCIRGTGVKVTFIASDWSEVHAELPINFRTRNYVGTIFGGSLYGAADPFYMLMLIKRLGKGYIVWDKAAEIEFLKPGRETLFARFLMPDEEIAEIKKLLIHESKVIRTYSVELVNSQGVPHARIHKRIHIRKAS